MLLFVEMVFPEWAVSRVGLILVLAVEASKKVGTGLAVLCFEPRQVDFVIGFATPCKFSMVDGLVWAIVFDALCLLYSTNDSSMAPLLAIFALKDAWIHVGTLNSHNEPFYVEPLVDERFSFGAALSIPDVDPYDGHIRFR